MKFLIISADYPAYRDWLYQQNQGLENRSYHDQVAVRLKSPFGIGDYYAQNLNNLGHRAWNLHVGNEHMQKAWAREHDLNVENKSKPDDVLQRMMNIWRRIGRTPARYLKSILGPLYRSLDKSHAWRNQILAEQIRHYQPDIVINLVMDFVADEFWEEIKQSINMLIGQIAWISPDQKPTYSVYDLVFSSLPTTINWLQAWGVPARMLRLGFQRQTLSQIRCQAKPIPISFVGSLFKMHHERVDLLERISQRFDLGIWGPKTDVYENPPLTRTYRGPAWGIEMFNILCKSTVTLNHHIDIGGNFANNMRLYEATGCGTFLLTDWKENLHELFESGAEVVAYHDADECLDLIEYYLKHDQERDKIARAGQQRTLAEHTYEHRVKEMLSIVKGLGV